MSGIIGAAGTKSGVIGTTELDYEEGTWSPNLNDSDSNFQHATTNGFYTKVGNRVFCNGKVVTDGMSGVTGGNSVRCTGLPFACSSSTDSWGGGTMIHCTGLSITASENIQIRVDYGGTTFYLPKWDGTAGTTNLTCDEWSVDGSGIFAFQYMTDE